MTATFLDTSFLLALTSPKDSLHRHALGWQKALTGSLITTEFILLEVADGFASRKASSVACILIDYLRAAPGTTIVPADAGWVAKGYQLFCSRLDKNWTLTDCISFEVMRTMGITDALTHDRHFEQAGFRALLREDPPNN
ncbi:MAG TPA: PIN domain-containing protein [Phycisphaerae bacterium]|nr:PIN domain-containing protein [Phycisphaerae bacterium]